MLDGVDSIQDEITIHDEHFHTRERWFGISADQSGDDWALDTLNAFVAISGAGVYGADPDDEAAVIGLDDMPSMAGLSRFDMHRILIEDVGHGTPYKLRMVWGTGTMADAITAGQCSEVMVQFDVANPQLSAGVPVDVRIPRLFSGVDKVWVQARNATNNSEIKFFVGVHEYAR
jgi:hypothetical protein